MLKIKIKIPHLPTGTSHEVKELMVSEMTFSPVFLSLTLSSAYLRTTVLHPQLHLSLLKLKHHFVV